MTKLWNRFRSCAIIVAALTIVLTVSPPAFAASDGSVGAWQTASNSLPVPLYKAASVTNNGFVYEIGGFDGSTTVDTIYYASLNSDSSVGAWQTASNSLPSPLSSLSASVHNNYLYITGGDDAGGSRVDTVYYAPLNPDGSIGAWITSANNLPDTISQAASVIDNNYLYMIGGVDTFATLDTIYYAPLNSDGSVGAWLTASTPLPEPRSQPAMMVKNNILYLLGGHSTFGSGTDDVYYAPLNPDGTVSAWSISPNPVPQKRVWDTTVEYNNFVYLLAGRDQNGVLVDNVFYAPINVDGTIGIWQDSSNPVPTAVDFATSVVQNNFIYQLGGRSGSGATDNVYYSALPAAPQPVIPQQPIASSSQQAQNSLPQVTAADAMLADTGASALLTQCIAVLLIAAALFSRHRLKKTS